MFNIWCTDTVSANFDLKLKSVPLVGDYVITNKLFKKGSTTEFEAVKFKVLSRIFSKIESEHDYDLTLIVVEVDESTESAVEILGNLSDLDLSWRSVFLLNNVGIKTIEDLIKFSRNDLLCIPEMNSSKINEIEVALSKINHSLKLKRS